MAGHCWMRLKGAIPGIDELICELRRQVACLGALGNRGRMSL